ncbi:hypothetical protein SADUNF_Sadunf05G0012200 [Salix dunnii]|uniref:Pectinesterase inhibitor domain-containing protein n=1 Tax=Salix dunnii TaxID=1413687 RepID=A0A835K1W5_9ROSI|nr:hypothetical protein SADUNF_Sadunf05G0012200 [Salix dunnii]
MGSLRGHFPFFFVVVLVLSSNHILVDAHNDSTTRVELEADFKVIAELAGNTAIPNTDFKSLAKLSLTNAIASCNAIHSHINSLLKISNSYTGRCLTGCSTNYEDAVGLITKSLAALEARDYVEAKALISDALANATKCEDRFQELLQLNSPFILMKAKFGRLCLIGIKHINRLVRKERLITEGCSHTLDKELCKSSVEFFLENKGLSLQGLAKLAVEKTLQDCTKIHNHISVLLKTSSDECLLKKLRSCSGHYQTAIAKIRDSLPALECKRYGDARAWVGAAIDWAETCEGVIAGKSNTKSPLTPLKTDFNRQAALALSVIYKLAGN